MSKFNKINDNYSRVVNLSNCNLNKTHYSVLAKGITFAPTPGEADLAQIHSDVNAFIRRIKLKVHFHKDETTPEDLTFQNQIPKGLLKFRTPSAWTPPNRDPHLSLFETNVNRAIANLQPISHFNQNLTKEEQSALNELRMNDNIVIKKADKSSSIVVMNKVDYIQEATRQLSDTNYYLHTDHDLTLQHHEHIQDLLIQLHDKHEISEHIYKLLAFNNPKTPALYLLPKIHKIKNPGEFPPGRPIISANESPTERISAFVDENIKTGVPTIPSYIKDTTDFIRTIESIQIPENCILASFDVTSLYTNIPNNEGMAAVSRFLNVHKPHLASPRTVIRLLNEVLTKNNFSFNGEHYLQVGGTAMGTRLAPSYANIFMGDLESQLLTQAPYEPFLWLRYIDDIFVIWTHGMEKLTEFHTFINNYHPTIKFTLEQSDKEIVFLDTIVKKNTTNDRLIVELYTKPTDTHNYLHFKSSHPGHTKRGGPYGQFLRIRRNCTLTEDYIKHSLIMKQHYIKRGYPPDLVECSRIKALNQNRKTLLNPPNVNSSQNKTTTNIVPLVLTHHPTNFQIRKIIMDQWGILKYSEICQKALPDKPLFATRRAKNLKDSLIHSRMNPHLNPGKSGRIDLNNWVECRRKECELCARLMCQPMSAKSTSTGKTHNIPDDSQCTMTNVIYLLTCSVCKLQYIGETKNSFRRRFGDHNGYIRRKEKQPTAIHMNRHNDPTGHYIPQILEVIHRNPDLPETTAFRKKREVFWIYRFKTLIPKGLNKLG